MTCRDAQTKLSLYLYGELAFTEEEEFEQHLTDCAVCERALESEKAWHSGVKVERLDVPLELLAECRDDLKNVIESAARGKPVRGRGWSSSGWLGWFGLGEPRWSMRLAVGSFLVLIGFSAAQYMDRNGITDGVANGAREMGLINPSVARIRDIEPAQNHRVRVVFEQEQAITGPVDSETVRQLLLAATTDEADPGIRMDSVEFLNGQPGEDVRDALLNSARRDPNVAVRLKAVEALAGLRNDVIVREGLVYVLQHDENAGVRSDAIDVLASANSAPSISPDMADALRTVVRSSQPDDYVRLRCMQLLRSANAPFDVY